jgi:proteic killer suppression protein
MFPQRRTMHNELLHEGRSYLAACEPRRSRRLRQILALLETSETLDDMNLPGLNLHELKGKRKGTWSVIVSGNWRVTFKLQEGDAFDVNYEDYH